MTMKFAHQVALEQQKALRLERERLAEVAKREVCLCGNELRAAYVKGVWRLACGKCGYDPDTRPRVSESLTVRYQKYGIQSLNALERQTLALSLDNSIRDAEARGERPLKRMALRRRVLRVMGTPREEKEEDAEK